MANFPLGRRRCLDPLRGLPAHTTYHIGMGEGLGAPLPLLDVQCGGERLCDPGVQRRGPTWDHEAALTLAGRRSVVAVARTWAKAEGGSHDGSETEVWGLGWDRPFRKRWQHGRAEGEWRLTHERGHSNDGWRKDSEEVGLGNQGRFNGSTRAMRWKPRECLTAGVQRGSATAREPWRSAGRDIFGRHSGRKKGARTRKWKAWETRSGATGVSFTRATAK